MVIILRKRGSAFKTILMILIGVVALIFLSSYLMPLLMRNSFLLTTKYEQAMKLFSFGSGNWFDNIPSSPKMRITEFMNVAEEYIRKPWFAPLGKGFCGTVKDHLGLFTDLTEFSFSKWELDLFKRMQYDHDTKECGCKGTRRQRNTAVKEHGSRGAWRQRNLAAKGYRCG